MSKIGRFRSSISSGSVWKGAKKMAVKAAPYILNVKAGTKEADLFLYDVIGDPWDGTTAKMFAADLKALGDLDTLNVFINSIGGSVWDGIAIYNQLVRNKARKKIYVDGIAASIASVIAMAGDEITTAKNGMWMIHNPIVSIFMASADELRQTADRLTAIREVILATYVDRAGAKTDVKQFGLWMNEEKWFSAQEALDAGLTDFVSEKDVEIAAVAKHDLSRFRNAPAVLREQQVAAVSAGRVAQPASLLAAKAAARTLARRAS